MKPARRAPLVPLLLGLALSVAHLLLAGCKREDVQVQQVVPSLRTVQMQIGRERFTLEVAANDRDRQQGLMHRASMPADRGMIFVFDRQQHLSFWMRNTRIPLDILYLDDDGRVVTIAQLKPFDESGMPSRVPARFAIELNAGTARRVDVRVGDVLNVPAEAQTIDRALPDNRGPQK